MQPMTITPEWDAPERTPGELKGYWLYVVTRELRPAFDGERAALLDRAQVLGVTLGDA